MQANIHFASVKDLVVDADHLVGPDDSIHAWVSIQDTSGGSVVIHVHDMETLDKLAFHLTSFARQLRTEAEIRETRHSDIKCDCPAREAGNADSPDLHTAQCAKSLQHHLIEPTGDLNDEPLRAGYDA